MLIRLSTRTLRRPSLAFVLFCAFLVILWLAGGASRATVMGQVVVRLVAVAILFTLALFADRPAMERARPVWWLLIGVAAVALLQLIPLPPAVWQALPGRAMFTEATMGASQPWRPLSIVPGATINALVALLVPVTALYLAGNVSSEERRLLPGAILVMITASCLLGIMQFSGVGLNNPLINDSPGEVGSSFANRNHLALLLTLGCVLMPSWIFSDGHRSHGRIMVGLGATLLFLLLILATGSRGGLLLGAIALGMSIVIARENIRRALRRAPRWAFPAVIAAVVGLIVGVVLVSVAADRAVSIQRVFAVDAGQDMRSRALPTVWKMTREYFPAGIGLGGFDPLFRIHEPLALLKSTYFNHAHNDVLELVLEAGLPGLLLLAAAFIWWGWATLRAWRDDSRQAELDPMLPRIGSAMLLLIAIASLFDYPARTPAMMALIVIAALWLCKPAPARRDQALP